MLADNKVIQRKLNDALTFILFHPQGLPVELSLLGFF